ncbi:MAG TPA: sigma-70 family RNA polymerase sigma factor [Mucilaginibacter sp.]|nr:sigma-70 family RNA polymerase sigma factor [Mucilaginibacter sp.]
MRQSDLHTGFLKQVNEHKGIIYKVCSVYAENESDRKDLYQEIVIQAWKGFEKFRGEAKFSTWLYQVAINTAIAGFRKMKRSPVIFTDDDLSDVAVTQKPNGETEETERLYSAINRLNEIEKAIVVLYLDGKSYEEMEVITGITNGALRVKMTRIKEKLRQLTKDKSNGT